MQVGAIGTMVLEGRGGGGGGGGKAVVLPWF